MGEIIETKRDLTKVIYKVKLPIEEAIQLKNHMKRIHLFCSGLSLGYTKIIERGNNGGAKYFIIPLVLKSRTRKKFTRIAHQKIKINNQTYYIFVASKE
jgi:hypothetical protein